MAETIVGVSTEEAQPAFDPSRLAFLDEEHPVYHEWATAAAPATTEASRNLDGGIALAELALTGTLFDKDKEFGAWQRNERRFRGGDEVLGELRPFDWERAHGPAYRARQAQACYVNFPDRFASTLVGHLYREAPQPQKGLDFGTLGEVRRKDQRSGEPTRAELVYFNATGTGADGSQWDAFWSNAAKRAQATGHRWIFVDAPERQPRTLRDEINGLRPYLVEYSPMDVTNWHYEDGRLVYAVIRVPIRKLRLSSTGALEGNKHNRGYLVLVADGFTGLAPVFGAQGKGGWWKFDSDKKLESSGDWSKTNGAIPLFPLYYERDTGTEDKPAISRPGLTELGQLAVSYMNLDSAADFDAWDAAVSITWLLGVDPEAFNTAINKISGGNRYIPVPRDPNAGITGAAPGDVSIQDGSTGAVTADVFDRRLAAKIEAAENIMMHEASSTPDSSGESKAAGFAEGKSPRLALMASNLEEAQNTAIHFLELRFGTAKGAPAGSAVWPREFDLRPVAEDVQSFLEAQVTAGVTSPTATARAIAILAREKRVITDDAELQKVEQEITDAIAANELEQKQEDAEREATRDALEEDGGTGGDE